MNADPHPWARELGTLYDHAWHRVIRGVRDRHAPARHPTLATVSSEGLPQARTVVLRKADRTSGRLEIHTNLFSPKVVELKATPDAAPFAVVHLHIRLMDLLHLGSQHRRAQFVREGGWVGHWVAP